MLHTSGAMLLGLGLPILAVSLSTASVSGSGTSSTVTSGPVTANVTGGSGLRTHAWSRVSGSTSISADASTSATTSFTGTGIGIGSSLSATFKDTITDTLTGEVVETAAVTVYVERSNPALSLGVSGSGVKTLTSSTTITVTSDGVTLVPSGGVPPYSNYAHNYLSGSSDFLISSAGSATTTHSRALGPGGGVSGTVRGSVVDAIGQVATVDYGVVLINNGSPPPTLSASASPSSVDGYASGIVVVTPSVTATPSGGSGSYVSHSWTRVGGVGDPTSPSSATTTFSAGVGYGETLHGTFLYTVTDSLGNTATTTVSASFTNWGTPPGGFG